MFQIPVCLTCCSFEDVLQTNEAGDKRYKQLFNTKMTEGFIVNDLNKVAARPLCHRFV